MEIRRNIDELNKEVWTFSLINNVLYLNTYNYLNKESTKHRKYKSIKKFDRLMRRDSTIEESEVPFTSEIKQHALNKYFDSVKCMRWSER